MTLSELDATYETWAFVLTDKEAELVRDAGITPIRPYGDSALGGKPYDTESVASGGEATDQS